jgi:hypothetical protein
MSAIHILLTLLAMSGLVLAVVLEIRRSRAEDRQWHQIASRLGEAQGRA